MTSSDTPMSIRLLIASVSFFEALIFLSSISSFAFCCSAFSFCSLSLTRDSVSSMSWTFCSDSSSGLDGSYRILHKWIIWQKLVFDNFSLFGFQGSLWFLFFFCILFSFLCHYHHHPQILVVFGLLLLLLYKSFLCM